MFNLRKADETLVKSLNLQTEIIEIYELLKNNETSVGFGVINKDINNMVTIYILDQYRGNGYGKILFEKILEKIKVLGYNEIQLTFDKNNIMMKKIVTGKKGLEISNDKDQITYVVPVCLI